MCYSLKTCFFLFVLSVIVLDPVHCAPKLYERNKFYYGRNNVDDEYSSRGSSRGISDEVLNGSMNNDTSAASNTDNTNAYTGDKTHAQNDPSSKYPNKDKTRPLKSGDIFTPQEMYPIAIRLMNKVENVGEGKGIVSGATNPKHLADQLFEAYFGTLKRIVTLQDADIPGLDAFQALAISGDVVDAVRLSHSSYTDAQPTEDEQIYSGPIKCHYKFISKEVQQSSKLEKETSRRTLEHIKKHLGQNRKLVVNQKSRRELQNNHQIKSNNKKGPKNLLPKVKKINSASKTRREKHGRAKENSSNMNKRVCRWRYFCAMPAVLETCRLYADCRLANNQDLRKYIGKEHANEGQARKIRLFRKMVGIEAVDEEVEKILESHILSLSPQRLGADERIETLAQYFNNIVNKESQDTTPAMDVSDTGKNVQGHKLMYTYSTVKLVQKTGAGDDDDTALKILNAVPTVTS